MKLIPFDTYFCKIKEIPKDMRAKLPPSFHSALEISAPLKQSSLQRTVGEMTKFYFSQFELVFPPLNTSLLTVKHVRDLALPRKSPNNFSLTSLMPAVEIIPAIPRLASLLSISFSYSTTAMSTSRNYKPALCPETQLISLLIIATKLSQPFDDIRRYPSSLSDATTVKLDWKKWVSIIADPKVSGLKRGEELSVKDDDVWKMDGKMMDDYMDWYQRIWIDDRKPKSNSSSLTSLQV